MQGHSHAVAEPLLQEAAPGNAKTSKRGALLRNVLGSVALAVLLIAVVPLARSRERDALLEPYSTMLLQPASVRRPMQPAWAFRSRASAPASVQSHPSLATHGMPPPGSPAWGNRHAHVARAAPADVLEEVSSVPAPAAPKRKVVGRTAVITGSSQGSGKAIALELAKRGWNVALVARQPERLAAAAAEVDAVSSARRTGSVFDLPCDIAKGADVDAFSAAVLEHFERVDLLVNNAGVCLTASVCQTSVEEYERLMQSNFMGAVRMTKALLPALKASKGSIVNVNSFGGVIPLRGMSAYTASKFALAGWSDALRAELEPEGIHVAQVHPGIINSNFLERAVFEKEDGAARMRDMLNSAPFVQKPEEIAEAVLQAQQEKKPEVVVGGVFQGAVAAYRLTGANPFALNDPNKRL